MEPRAFPTWETEHLSGLIEGLCYILGVCTITSFAAQYDADAPDEVEIGIEGVLASIVDDYLADNDRPVDKDTMAAIVEVWGQAADVVRDAIARLVSEAPDATDAQVAQWRDKMAARHDDAQNRW